MRPTQKKAHKIALILPAAAAIGFALITLFAVSLALAKFFGRPTAEVAFDITNSDGIDMQFSRAACQSNSSAGAEFALLSLQDTGLICFTNENESSIPLAVTIVSNGGAMWTNLPSEYMTTSQGRDQLVRAADLRAQSVKVKFSRTVSPFVSLCGDIVSWSSGLVGAPSAYKLNTARVYGANTSNVVVNVSLSQVRVHDAEIGDVTFVFTKTSSLDLYNVEVDHPDLEVKWPKYDEVKSYTLMYARIDAGAVVLNPSGNGVLSYPGNKSNTIEFRKTAGRELSQLQISMKDDLPLITRSSLLYIDRGLSDTLNLSGQAASITYRQSQQILTPWEQLSPELQAALIGVLFAVSGWAARRLWQNTSRDLLKLYKPLEESEVPFQVPLGYLVLVLASGQILAGKTVKQPKAFRRVYVLTDVLIQNEDKTWRKDIRADVRIDERQIAYSYIMSDSLPPWVQK